MASIIEEFLVGLNFSVNAAQFATFQQHIQNATKLVQGAAQQINSLMEKSQKSVAAAGNEQAAAALTVGKVAVGLAADLVKAQSGVVAFFSAIGAGMTTVALKTALAECLLRRPNICNG